MLAPSAPRAPAPAPRARSATPSPRRYSSSITSPMTSTAQPRNCSTRGRRCCISVVGNTPYAAAAHEPGHGGPVFYAGVAVHAVDVWAEADRAAAGGEAGGDVGGFVADHDRVARSRPSSRAASSRRPHAGLRQRAGGVGGVRAVVGRPAKVTPPRANMAITRSWTAWAFGFGDEAPADDGLVRDDDEGMGSRWSSRRASTAPGSGSISVDRAGSPCRTISVPSRSRKERARHLRRPRERLGGSKRPGTSGNSSTRPP